MFSYYQYCIDS